MKPLSTASSAVINILASAAVSVSANKFPLPIPTFRYEPFNKLDTTSQNIAEEKLGYIEVTWNNHALNPVEKNSWADLTSNERDGANLLGYTIDQWDCFINHYEGYTWDELADRGVQEYYEGLGWTREHWEGTAGTIVYTESRWWGQLTDNEKRAANGLCYFQDNWDKIDMNPNPSFFPHPPPNFRYRPWGELDPVTRNVASNMMNYTEELWNDLGSSVVEKNTFLNLDPIQRAGALDLGFYTHTWDCFMNHYLAYYWSSFHDDLKVAIETLGWTEEMWSGDVDMEPESEDKVWIDLTAEEKAAATRLCYFKETWDGENIERWYDYDAGMNTAITTDGPVPKDINLGIFEGTGYTGKEPGKAGTTVYTATTADPEKASSAGITIFPMNMSVLSLLIGTFVLAQAVLN